MEWSRAAVEQQQQRIAVRVGGHRVVLGGGSGGGDSVGWGAGRGGQGKGGHGPGTGGVTLLYSRGGAQAFSPVHAVQTSREFAA